MAFWMFPVGAILAKKLGEAIGGYLGGGAAQDEGPDVQWYHVPPHALRAFRAQHPGALEAGYVVSAMLARGNPAAARYYQAGLEESQQRYPGCEIYVEVK